MTDKQAIVEARDTDFSDHRQGCVECQTVPWTWGMEWSPIPSDLCDDGRAIAIRALRARQACDICTIDGTLGNNGTFRFRIEHVSTEQGRTILVCLGHLGAMAKQLEDRWPWPDVGNGFPMHAVDDPACQGSCRGKWKWPGLVQRWFAPLFQIVADEVADAAGGIFR